MQIFFSRVSAEFEFFDRYFNDQFGHLPQFRLITQRKIEGNLTGWHTLDKLYDELQQSPVVVHLLGGQLGARPRRPEDIEGFLQRQPTVHAWLIRHQLDPADWSYTQWEAMLAACLQDHEAARQLYLARPENPLIHNAEEQQGQQAHETRLRRVSRYVEMQINGRDPRRWIEEVFVHLKKSTNLVSTARQCLHRQSIQQDLKGRDQALQDLALKLPLGQGAQVVITSGAGRGKTCLAVEYAYRHQAHYHSLLLVRCDNLDTLAASLAGLARCLKLASTDSTDAAAEQAVRHWLRDRPGWLLIVDNIEDAAGRNAALSLLGELGPGHVLVTSRDRHWPASVSAYKLDELAPDAAAALLLAAGVDGQSQGSTAQAIALAEDLGRVANVLVQARAYMRARDLSVSRYHQRWKDAAQRRKLLQAHDEAVSGYPKSAAHTWLTTWDALRTPARTLLQLWSWLASAPIPRADLPALAGIATELPDADTVEEACAELRRYCLLQALEGELLLMHPIDQMIARDQWVADSRAGAGLAWRWLTAVLVSEHTRELPQNFLDRERAWRPHAEHLLSHREQFPVDDLASLLIQLANFANCRGDHPAARAWIASAETLPWPATTTAQQLLIRARSACTRSELEYHQANFPAAERAARAGLALLSSAGTADAAPVWRRQAADLTDMLGHIAKDKGDLEAARTAFAQAEAIRRALTLAAPDNDAYRREWSISLNNLGRVAEAQGDLEAARTAFEQVEAIFRALTQAAPDNDAYRREWSISLENLGRVAQTEGDLEAARTAFAQAETIRRALTQAAPDNDAYRREWSISLNNVGRVAEAKGDLEAARTAFAQDEAISHALTLAAPDNDAYRREWSISLENLGRVAEKKGDLEAARTAFAQAEAISRALTLAAPDHDAYRRDWSISLNNLGRVAETKGDVEAARTAFAQVKTIFRALTLAAPDNDAYRREWSISLLNQARVAAEVQQALALAERSTELMRDLVQRQPSEWHWREELVRHLLPSLLWCAHRAGKTDQAQLVIAEIKTHLDVLQKADRHECVEEVRAWIDKLRQQ
ncbi:MAG: tetratricopeptide repeat protein [Xanthomonadales bacterium]|jgi:tetratricopeptide (TPR) repeat protein|nr:tetratricopeptide repeat protein [Xanthomonadales bacterium]